MYAGDLIIISAAMLRLQLMLNQGILSSNNLSLCFYTKSQVALTFEHLQSTSFTI